jgi:hypothetical protein
MRLEHLYDRSKATDHSQAINLDSVETIYHLLAIKII